MITVPTHFELELDPVTGTRSVTLRQEDDLVSDYVTLVASAHASDSLIDIAAGLAKERFNPDDILQAITEGTPE